MNAEDIIFATIDGRSYLRGDARRGRHVELPHARRTDTPTLDSESFWRPHRSYLVNIHHIKEVVPWFKSSYMLKMNDKKQTEVPVSRVQTKRLRELFKL